MLFLSRTISFCLCFSFFVLSRSQSIPPTFLLVTQLEMNSDWARLPYNTSRSNWIPNLYRLNAPVPLRFEFTDAFCPGERVSVFVNGTLYANSTDVPIPATGGCEPDLNLPEGTAAFPEVYSRLELDLPAGQHQIAFKLIQNNPAYTTGIMFARAYIPFESGCPCSNWFDEFFENAKEIKKICLEKPPVLLVVRLDNTPAMSQLGYNLRPTLSTSSTAAPLGSGSFPNPIEKRPKLSHSLAERSLTSKVRKSASISISIFLL